MIIFGWGRQTIKQIGIAFKQICSHCNNEEFWILTRTITWFTLFFIPIIPYSVKYFLSCPVCKYGLTLEGKQLETIKPVAKINQLLANGQITDNEYQLRISQLNSSSATSVDNEIVETKILSSGEKNLSYCGNCGTGITKELKFCEDCGVAIISK